MEKFKVYVKETVVFVLGCLIIAGFMTACAYFVSDGCRVQQQIYEEIRRHGIKN